MRVSHSLVSPNETFELEDTPAGPQSALAEMETELCMRQRQCVAVAPLLLSMLMETHTTYQYTFDGITQIC